MYVPLFSGCLGWLLFLVAAFSDVELGTVLDRVFIVFFMVDRGWVDDSGVGERP